MDCSLLRRIVAVFTVAGFIAISQSSWAQTADLSVSMTADRLKAKIGEHVVYRVLVTTSVRMTQLESACLLAWEISWAMCVSSVRERLHLSAA